MREAKARQEEAVGLHDEVLKHAADGKAYDKELAALQQACAQVSLLCVVPWRTWALLQAESDATSLAQQNELLELEQVSSPTRILSDLEQMRQNKQAVSALFAAPILAELKSPLLQLNSDIDSIRASIRQNANRLHTLRAMTAKLKTLTKLIADAQQYQVLSTLFSATVS